MRRPESVVIDDVSVRFGPFEALSQARLSIAPGELFTLLGPSGCGKTTLLRAIAGFNTVAAGRILFGERDITGTPPWSRDIGFVFQNYALWPTKTIFENVAYGLRVRKVAEPEIRTRVMKALERVELAHTAAQHPGELSGGMQQRAALARALVIDPPVLLLDEPLSNLDAKLRVSLRSEIRALQKSLGLTAVYVTHDQEEALDISDRIAVMKAGRILQVGTPTDIYASPATAFVADFVGKASFLAGRVHEGRFRLDGGPDLAVPLLGLDDPAAARCAFVRPEDVAVVAPGQGVVDGTVALSSYLGNLSRSSVVLPGGQHLLVEGRRPLAVGDTVGLAIPSLRLFAAGPAGDA